MARGVNARAREHLKRGNYFYHRGRFGEAGDCYREAIETYPDFAEAHYNLGIVYGKHEAKFAEAISEFERAIAVDFRFVEARKNLVFSYYHRDDYGSALKHLKVARMMGAKFDPGFVDAVREESRGASVPAKTRGRRGGNGGQKAAAFPDAEVAAISPPQEAISALELWEDITRLRHVGRSTLARLLILPVIIAAGAAAVYFFTLPKTAEGYLRRGGKLLERRKISTAVRYLRTAAEMEPESAVIHYFLGKALFLGNELARAETVLKKAVALDAGNVDGHNLLAQVYHGRGMYDEAIAERLKIVDIGPDWDDVTWAVFYNNLGFAYIEKEKYNPAIQALKKAVELWPEDAEAYTNLGYIYSKAGRWEYAVDMYQRALKIKPDLREAHYSLGWAFFNQRDYGQAWIEMEEARKLGYLVETLTERLNEIAREYKQEIARCNEIIAADPENAGAHNDLAVAYYFTHQFDLALRHAETAEQLGYQINPLVRRGLENVKRL